MRAWTAVEMSCAQRVLRPYEHVDRSLLHHSYKFVENGVDIVRLLRHCYVHISLNENLFLNLFIFNSDYNFTILVF
jgi:hypothetical protein